MPQIATSARTKLIDVWGMEGDGRSSSNDLSSAPPSDAEAPPRHSLNVSRGAAYNATPPGNHSLANSLLVAPSSASATAAGTRQESLPPVKARKPRKAKDPNAPPEPKKERAPRKPRAAAAATGASSRKKPKIEKTEESDTIQIHSTPASSGLQSSTLVQPVTFPTHDSAEAHLKPHEAAKTTQSGLSMNDSPMSSYNTAAPHQPSYDYLRNVVVPPPASPPAPASRSMYDPIRSLTIQRPPDPTPASSAPVLPTQTPPRPTYHPSQSPAISGIIDPPASYSQPATSLPTHPAPADVPMATPDRKSNPPPSPKVNGSTPKMDGAQVDLPPVKKNANAKKGSSEAPTRATSPKPARAKEQPPPPPLGSGLLSASLFGGESSTGPAQGEKGPNIILHVDLKDPNNRVINFARLAEEKYGFAALYPRQAAQKERLAKIAAAGAALERSVSGSKAGGTSAGDSGDEDLSVDIDRDSDNDGDVAMTGVNGGQDAGNSGTDVPGPKRRRRRKVEEYDQDDPFVDDSEMLWEAQAAASKDGFFVYCGPLVPEGEKPAVERADGTIKRGRGRGRGGGGPGSRGGRAAAATTGEAAAGRASGPGSRGGGTTRKPRITKAERLQREQEKLQREKIAQLVAKPQAYSTA